jgi:hypothetical protein
MKNIRRHNLLAAAFVGALVSITSPLVAQDGTNAVAVINPVESPERPLYRPWTVGIEAGTEGIFGGAASWRFSDHLGLRVAADYAEASLGHHVGIAGIHYDAKLRLLSEPLLLDWYPWKKHSFHVGLGLMFNQNELSGTASDTGTITIDGQPFPSSGVGSLHMKVKQQPVNPYLTIGGNLFYFDHAHHWALAGELGVAYTGDAQVSLTRSGSASPAIDYAMRQAQNRLQRYVDDYKFWPVAKLAVTFSF